MTNHVAAKLATCCVVTLRILAYARYSIMCGVLIVFIFMGNPLSAVNETAHQFELVAVYVFIM